MADGGGINTPTNQNYLSLLAAAHGHIKQSSASTVRFQRLVLTASNCSDVALDSPVHG
jgi:hypothetical protein